MSSTEDADFSATKKMSRNSRRRDKLSRVWFMPSKVLNMREEINKGRGRIMKGERIGLEIFRQLSCKVCRKTFHKIQGLVFHGYGEDHGQVNPSWSRRFLKARFVLTDKLRVQDVTEFEEITDLETNVLREKRILPERPFSAKKMKKYNLVVVVRTVPEDIIHNITETDDSNSEDIEVVSDCPTSSSPTLLKETSCCRQQLPGQRLGAMDKVAAWLVVMRGAPQPACPSPPCQTWPTHSSMGLLSGNGGRCWSCQVHSLLFNTLVSRDARYLDVRRSLKMAWRHSCTSGMCISSIRSKSSC